MKMKAAITEGVGEKFIIRDVEIDDPADDEVLVKVVASGLCHTDLSVRDGYMPFPFPAILGHEGAGIVERVGRGVKKVVPGDHVIMTFPHCGICHNCQSARPTYCPETQKWIFSGTGKRPAPYLKMDDSPLSGSFLGQSSFAEYALMTEEGLVKVTEDAPLEILGPLGCSFQTGAGAVLRSLDVPFGSTLAIFGSGNVGCAAAMAAAAKGVSKIIAVDINDQRLEFIRTLGATHTINSTKTAPVEEIRSITNGVGADYALWAVGVSEAINPAFDCLSQTGVLGLLGVAPIGEKVTLDIYDLFRGKTVRGILAGDSVPDILIPQLIDLFQQGRFPLDSMTKEYDLDDINQAAEDLEAARTLKPILRIA